MMKSRLWESAISRIADDQRIGSDGKESMIRIRIAETIDVLRHHPHI
jgi:hypothetical protein